MEGTICLSGPELLAIAAVPLAAISGAAKAAIQRRLGGKQNGAKNDQPSQSESGAQSGRGGGKK